MIIAEQKSLDEVKSLIGSADNVLVVGCGTCVTVCFAGGSREAAILSSSLRMSSKLDGLPREVNDVTVQRQCEWEYNEPLKERLVFLGEKSTVVVGIISQCNMFAKKQLAEIYAITSCFEWEFLVRLIQPLVFFVF